MKVTKSSEHQLKEKIDGGLHWELYKKIDTTTGKLKLVLEIEKKRLFENTTEFFRNASQGTVWAFTSSGDLCTIREEDGMLVFSINSGAKNAQEKLTKIFVGKCPSAKEIMERKLMSEIVENVRNPTRGENLNGQKYYDEALKLYDPFDKSGVGITQSNYAKAFALFKKAADEGHSLAMNNIGYMYDCGLSVPKDENLATMWYRKGAENGNSCAQNNLGYAYQYGCGVDVDLPLSVKMYRKAADQGNPEGMYNVGFSYLNGYGVEKNPTETAYWLRLSTNNGHRRAMYNLGYLFEQGMGVKKDKREALKLFRESARRGYSTAYCQLAHIYQSEEYEIEEGDVIKRNLEECILWLRKAIDKSDKFSQDYLAYFYHEGLGISVDKYEAVKLYRKSNSSDSLTTVTHLYEQGY